MLPVMELMNAEREGYHPVRERMVFRRERRDPQALLKPEQTKWLYGYLVWAEVAFPKSGGVQPIGGLRRERPKKGAENGGVGIG